MRLARRALPVAVFVLSATVLPSAQSAPDRIAALKSEIAADVESRKVFTQRMVDTIFSFSEVGFEEVETQSYVTAMLEKEGFRVQRGVAGIPTGGSPVGAAASPSLRSRRTRTAFLRRIRRLAS